MSGGIFISYRREDSAGASGRLHDHLAARFGRETVFMDVDAIEPGVDFYEVLNNQVGACDVLIAVIGRNWLSACDDSGNPRIANMDDFVRIEIAAALERNVRVIPLLVEGATMPSAEELPPSLRSLARRNAAEISHTRFIADVDRLADVIEKIVVPARPEPVAVQSGPGPAGPSLDGDPFAARICDALRPFQDNVKIFVAPNVPQDREASARPRTATGDSEVVLALIDFTVLNNGNDAMLITSLGLRIHHSTSEEPAVRFVSYEEIGDLPIFKTGWWKIGIGSQQITVSGGPNRDLLIRLLEAMRAAL